jgi:hypothetical protein
MLRERSKNFLAMHVILGGGILGITLAIVGLLLNFTNIFLTFEDYIGLFTIIQVSQLFECRSVFCCFFVPKLRIAMDLLPCLFPELKAFYCKDTLTTS